MKKIKVDVFLSKSEEEDFINNLNIFDFVKNSDIDYFTNNIDYDEEWYTINSPYKQKIQTRISEFSKKIKIKIKNLYIKSIVFIFVVLLSNSVIDLVTEGVIYIKGFENITSNNYIQFIIFILSIISGLLIFGKDIAYLTYRKKKTISNIKTASLLFLNRIDFSNIDMTNITFCFEDYKRIGNNLSDRSFNNRFKDIFDYLEFSENLSTVFNDDSPDLLIDIPTNLFLIAIAVITYLNNAEFDFLFKEWFVYILMFFYLLLVIYIFKTINDEKYFRLREWYFISSDYLNNVYLFDNSFYYYFYNKRLCKEKFSFYKKEFIDVFYKNVSDSICLYKNLFYDETCNKLIFVSNKEYKKEVISKIMLSFEDL